MAHVLVVDDLKNVRHVLALQLAEDGHQVVEADGGRAALGLLDKGVYDLVITDLRMGDLDGLTLLREIKRLAPATEVIVTTAYGTIESGVQAIKLGAHDYLTKPVKPEQMAIAVGRALEKRRMRAQIDQLREPASANFTAGHSPAWRELMAAVAKVAITDATVLLTGESGTGKEVVGGLIHAASRRQARALLKVNLGAVPESLQESELFGHVRGAFTGAVASRKGIFMESDGGTIFLDEIGEAAPSTQVAMLRVLAESEIRPVGGDRGFKVDVRVIAATNLDLQKAIAQGRFREDLYFRINVFPIRVPALRERVEDIPDLARHLLARHAARMGRNAPILDPGALEHLARHAWPGNVRELENVLERALILGHGESLMAEDLPLDSLRAGRKAGARPRQSSLRRLEDVEREHVLGVLRECGGNKQRAAEILGIGRATLFRRLKDHGMDLDPSHLETGDPSQDEM